MAIINKKIAILSGKGGTGKTLVSVNLAAVEGVSTYVDCDVEEPNGHLFFKPDNIAIENINIAIPLVNASLCTGCKKCVNFCRFNALAYIGKLMIFEEVCHSCGGCVLLCPEKALTEKYKTIGQIQTGNSQQVSVMSGILNTGEVSGVPIIKTLLNRIKEKQGYIFIDCPPGSACIVMESIKDADYCILVAEPTIFGAHNLKMVHELVKLFKKPYGVVLNKCTLGENPSEIYCVENGIKILEKIPFDAELGKISSDAHISARENSKYKQLFTSLLANVKEAVL
ncbi:MAG: ATP-binding protein [Clostridia bacterium]|nr:ATP-binding protein [Clostridia bacterium]